MSDIPIVKRRPFIINSTCVGVIELYHRPQLIDREFGWLWESLGNGDDLDYNAEAEELIGHLDGEYSIAFLMAVRNSCDKRIQEHVLRRHNVKQKNL